jgi:protein-disulfide isomerase
MEDKKKNTDTKETVKKEDYVEIPLGKYLGDVRKNPWIAATVVLALALILVLIFGAGGSGSVSADEAGNKVMTYINSNPSLSGQVSVVSTQKEGSFYQVMLNYQGQSIPVYTTLDGEFLVSNPVSLTGEEETQETETTQPTEVPKSDKPVVELFVMSHCPYGTQIEKGIIPVVELLGNKIDFSIKFVDYAMHGEMEIKEEMNQYCIEKEQNDKYLPYLKCFLKEGNGEGCLTETNVNKVKMNACVTKTDTQFKIMKNFNDKSTWLKDSEGQPTYPVFDVYKTENNAYGVQGSPTLVINGQKASSNRDSASLLKTICGAFNTAPEECNTELDGSSPSAGFGFQQLSGDANTAAQCG